MPHKLARSFEDRIWIFEFGSAKETDIEMISEYVCVSERRIAETRRRMAVVEQFAKLVLDVADEAVIMVQGRIGASGAPAELASELSSAYLGG